MNRLGDMTQDHTVFGDRHLSNLSEKVYHCKINFDIPTNRNESLEIKAQSQNFIDIGFQIIQLNPYS